MSRFLPIPWTDVEIGDLLRASTVEALIDAFRALFIAATRRHTQGTAASGGGGEHDDPLVAKGVALIEWDSPNYLLSSATHGNISGVNRIAEGIIDVTLDPPMQEGQPYRAVAVAVAGSGPSSGGRTASAEIIDHETVRVHLGVESVGRWDIYDGSFFVAVHGFGDPETSGDERFPPVVEWTPLQAMRSIIKASGISQLMGLLDAHRGAFLHRHTEDGEHDDPLVPRGWAVIRTGEHATPEIVDSAGIVDDISSGPEGYYVDLDPEIETPFVIIARPLGRSSANPAPTFVVADAVNGGRLYVAPWAITESSHVPVPETPILVEIYGDLA
jgi:hypothetical protein